MRVNWNYIKCILLLILVVFLFAFSSQKNKNRIITDVDIFFFNKQNQYITEKAVNKLLIQNNQSLTNTSKDILDLNNLELTLNSNPMIKNAEVYLNIKGKLIVNIEQRKPIARVHTDESFYIDDEGNIMPLSRSRSARVPLVTGAVDKNELKNLYKVAYTIYNDQFLKKNIIEIQQITNNEIVLKPRLYDFDIYLGNTNHLIKKVNNLKAFYQIAKKDKALKKYSKINLQFGNQVVCTKK